MRTQKKRAWYSRPAQKMPRRTKKDGLLFSGLAIVAGFAPRLEIHSFAPPAFAGFAFIERVCCKVRLPHPLQCTL